ncbi:peptide methionine sulfoxide reductase MsrA [Lipingzhangella halophila]|uniref:Peptide methionine sulfoxide reductase MsrA n=1 Tax=Lipingzhangella halophila TaxID=1783352 RepID=A0A7W7RC78_9ACTN|nr:peptide methionine sulfoxide reductase MsrA [Lipingzhangella halophila]
MPFYFAEGYHQQYLSDAKNPNGYCGVDGTGAACPVGVARA